MVGIQRNRITEGRSGEEAEPEAISWKARREFKKARGRKEESTGKEKYVRGIEYIRAWENSKKTDSWAYVLRNGKKSDS